MMSLNSKSFLGRIKNNRGTSLLEYSFLIMMILGSLFVMRDVISRGLFSKYKQTGESFSFGRQYDAKRTTVCRQDVINYEINGAANMGPYYDEDCFHTRSIRRPILVGGVWDAVNGGCPQCDPGNTSDSQACFNCEDAIKLQCAVAQNYCLK